METRRTFALTLPWYHSNSLSHLMRKSTLWDAITGITPTHPIYCSDEQLQGDLQSWKLEETSQPMSLHLLQARTTYSSPSTPFWVIYLDVNYARRFTEVSKRAKTNYIYILSITHLKGDVKKT